MKQNSFKRVDFYQCSSSKHSHHVKAQWLKVCARSVWKQISMLSLLHRLWTQPFLWPFILPFVSVLKCRCLVRSTETNIYCHLKLMVWSMAGVFFLSFSHWNSSNEMITEYCLLVLKFPKLIRCQTCCSCVAKKPSPSVFCFDNLERTLEACDSYLGWELVYF